MGIGRGVIFGVALLASAPLLRAADKTVSCRADDARRFDGTKEPAVAERLASDGFSQEEGVWKRKKTYSAGSMTVEVSNDEQWQALADSLCEARTGVAHDEAVQLVETFREGGVSREALERYGRLKKNAFLADDDRRALDGAADAAASRYVDGRLADGGLSSEGEKILAGAFGREKLSEIKKASEQKIAYENAVKKEAEARKRAAEAHRKVPTGWGARAESRPLTTEMKPVATAVPNDCDLELLKDCKTSPMMLGCAQVRKRCGQ